jgi:hypothetical protein
MAEIEGALGRQFQSLSIVFVCAVNTKLASFCALGNQVPTPDIYGAHWAMSARENKEITKNFDHRKVKEDVSLP